ncbi:MAG TPA: anti-sigma factor [Spirochaetia bacterium]|nr:anti-sigma factor [Spirochaetia bacterium]
MDRHEDIRELISAYALDALDPEESALVRGHLATCAACRRELAAYQRVTDKIALSAPEVSPPPDLEERILRQVSLLEPTRQKAKRWIGNPGLAVAATVLILVLAAGNLVQWVHSPQFQAQARGLVTVALVGSGQHRDAYGTIVVDMDDNEGVLAVRGLPSLGPEWRYELWLQRGKEIQSGGLFTVNENGYGSLLVRIPGGFRGFQTFSITVVPAEGNASSPSAPILSGGL